MTKYIHKETGTIIEFASVVTGDAWETLDIHHELETEQHETIEEPVEEVEEPVEEVEEQPDAESFDLTKMTVKELKEYAKENEIELPADAKKDEIIEVIADAFN